MIIAGFCEASVDHPAGSLVKHHNPLHTPQIHNVSLNFTLETNSLRNHPSLTVVMLDSGDCAREVYAFKKYSTIFLVKQNYLKVDTAYN